MAPVPIYSNSPIQAAKASGVTPQTAAPASASDSQPPITTASPTSTQNSYAQAQPGAVPSLPAPTGGARSERYAPLQPTPTQKLEERGPPAPQPGAVPVPPGARKTAPPPPKVGERMQPPEQTPAPQPAAIPYPAQMSVPAPSVPYSQRGTSAAATRYPAAHPHLPHQPLRPSGGPIPGANIDHPSGYQQDVNASEFTSHQRAAHDAFLSADHDENTPGTAGDGEEGMWDSAKKLVQAAGEKLSAAESEVWRRINKE